MKRHAIYAGFICHNTRSTTLAKDHRMDTKKCLSVFASRFLLNRAQLFKCSIFNIIQLTHCVYSTGLVEGCGKSGQGFKVALSAKNEFCSPSVVIAVLYLLLFLLRITCEAK